MTVKLKPTILAGIGFAAFSTILGMLLFPIWSALVPWYMELYYSPAFRPFDHPFTIGLYVLPLVEGIIFAVFYGALKKIIPCNTPYKRGATYGSLLFLLSGVPWLLLIVSLFNIPVILVSLWAIEGIARYYFGCGIMAAIFERME